MPRAWNFASVRPSLYHAKLQCTQCTGDPLALSGHSTSEKVLPVVVCSVLFLPQALSTLDSITLMYPFFYRPMFEVIEDGWHSFLPEQEFELCSSAVSNV